MEKHGVNGGETPINDKIRKFEAHTSLKQTLKSKTAEMQK